MHIQLALDLLASANHPHSLTEVSAGKFILPIPPEHPVEALIIETPTPHVYQVTLQSANQTHSTFTLTVR